MILSREQTETIIKQGQARGLTGQAVLEGLIRRGYEPEGIDVSVINRQTQGEDVKPEDAPRGFVAETRQDLSQVTEGIEEDITRRADIVADIKQADISPTSKAFQTLGQGAGFAGDVVSRTIVGAGKALLPESLERNIGEIFTRTVENVVDTETFESAQQRFEQLKEESPELAGNLLAGANILLLTADVLGGAGLSKTVQPVARTAGRVGAGAARVTGQATEKSVGLGARGAAEIQGVLTGTSGETIEQAFDAARRGGTELEAFTKALRSETTPEQLVDIARSSVQAVSTRKSQNFGRAISGIVDESVDTSKIVPQVNETLAKLNVVPDDNGILQFGASKFRTVPQAQTKLQELYTEINRLGKRSTLGQVDTSRQALGNLLLSGDDASARTANLAINDAIAAVRRAGTQIDGYDDALRQFADDADFLDELNRSLATGDSKTIDTAYRRLATTLKTNNEQRLSLVRQLDEETGGLLLSTIAGQQLSEKLPRGIFRQIAAGMAGGGIITGGLSTALLPTLVFASPRATGEFVRALGLGVEKTKQILEAIKAARKAFNP